MSLPVILDVETQHLFQEVNHDYKKLGVSFAGTYHYDTNKFEGYFENDLPKLFPLLESASMVIGFNIRKFDFPVLAPYYVGDINHIPVLDLLDEVEKFVGYRIALDTLASETLGTKKTGHGLLAIEYYRNKEFDKLKSYCLSDVQITRDLYEFGKREGKIYFKDVHGRREIPVSWKRFNASSSISLTFGF